MSAGLNCGTNSTKVALVAHQPNLFPRLKVLQKIAQSDIWVVLDDVQFANRDWQNRTRVLGNNGESEFWLSLPCARINGRSTLINDIKIIDFERNFKKLKRSFYHVFKGAPYWSDVELLLQIFERRLDSSSLTDVSLQSCNALLEFMGIELEIVLSSTLKISSSSTSRLVDICDSMSACYYIADSGAKKYLNVELFTQTKVVWQEWREPAHTLLNVHSWRNLSSVNYLAYFGRNKLIEHLAVPIAY